MSEELMDPRKGQAYLRSQPTSQCACPSCRRCCDRPCWPTPPEAQRIIKAGFGAKLMLDFWIGGGPNGDDIQILCPANPGYEGGNAPATSGLDMFSLMMGTSPLQSGCVLQQENGQCVLHGRLKPIEGRIAHHDRTEQDGQATHAAVAATWNTATGRRIVAAWKKRTMRRP